MGTKNKRALHKRRKSLAAGRPPTAQKPKSLSRKTTKRLINTHHQLEKRRQQALARGDTAEAAAAASEMEALGGLSTYQQASLQGQSLDRGGDSSRVLMQWLGLGLGEVASRTGLPSQPSQPSQPSLPSSSPASAYLQSAPLRMLEVGALSTQNACSVSGCFRMERIDLHSQGPGIQQQDFLQRPRPRSDAERFDLISLSLVLNYVPQHSDRGEMLLRCLDFLHEPGRVSAEEGEAKEANETARTTESADLGRFFPGLFMVLPEACVTNSRYLTEEKLTDMMTTLGFDLVESKLSQRLVYYLWKRVRARPRTIPSFAKKEVRTGPSRNNFSIVVHGT